MCFFLPKLFDGTDPIVVLLVHCVTKTPLKIKATLRRPSWTLLPSPRLKSKDIRETCWRVGAEAEATASEFGRRQHFRPPLELERKVFGRDVINLLPTLLIN